MRNVIIFSVLFAVLFGCSKTNYETTIVPATCTQGGYTIYENTKDGSVTIKDETRALGHSFADWKNDQRICKICGETESREISELGELPVLYLEGDISSIGKKNNVTLSVRFDGIDTSFDCFSSTSYQGHSTLDLDKHNYTLRLFDDSDLVSKHKIIFFGWQLEHKYILKANYYDVTDCRNLVAAKIWGDVVSSRENIDSHLMHLSNYGAVDGFPIAVYLNSDFLGVYNMNLHKDDDLFGMEKGEKHAIMIANAQSKDESLFKSEAVFEESGGDWELEFCGTEDDSWARKSFNELISFVMNSSDEQFKTELENYLDLDSAIDYLIYIYSMGLNYSGSKDLVMINYGDQWIATVYDMETAFGLKESSFDYFDASEGLPIYKGGEWSSNTESLLWDRLLNNFEDRIKERYNDLRKDVFNEEYISDMVIRFMDQIGSEYYRMDEEIYPNRNSFLSGREQILSYIGNRFTYLDKLFSEEK